MRFGLGFNTSVPADERFYLITGPDSFAELSVRMVEGIGGSLTIGTAPFLIEDGAVIVAERAGSFVDPMEPAILNAVVLDTGVTPDGRVTLEELAAREGRVFGSLSCNGAARVDVRLYPLPGMPADVHGLLQLDWTDLCNPASLYDPPTTADLEEYVAVASAYDPASAAAAVDSIVDMIWSWADQETLQTSVPFVGRPVYQLLDFMGLATTFFNSINAAHPSNAVEFDDAVITAVDRAGLDPTEVEVVVDPHNDYEQHNPALNRLRYRVLFDLQRTRRECAVRFWARAVLTGLRVPSNPRAIFVGHRIRHERTGRVLCLRPGRRPRSDGARPGGQRVGASRRTVRAGGIRRGGRFGARRSGLCH